LSEQFLIGLGVIILFGIMAQWLAWRFHLPSILLLLLLGMLAGPVTGLVDAGMLFGNLLFPFVSISVAIILFEGGLSLKFSEFRAIGGIIRNLNTIGAGATWLVATIAAYYLLDLEFKLALLFGAILIVTGPTVVLPLLRQVRPKGNLHSIAKWEGIIIDPVGAIVAVLVFEEIISGGIEQFSAGSLAALVKTLLVGLSIGWIGAQLIIFMLKRYWIPDFLHNAVAIMTVITTFIGSNLLQHESGLVTATVLGIVLTNQKKVSIKHIIEFKENLRVILISTLFIVLAARLKLEDLAILNLNMFLFLAILVFIARPLAVFLSAIGQDLNFREKVFLSWLAPRGIVAASVASIFAIELSAKGYPAAERLIPFIFIVIIATVALYGLTAGPLARLLKLSEANPQGVLMVGAHPWSIQLGRILNDAGFRVLLIDSNLENVLLARQKKLEAVVANVLAEDIIDQLNLQGIGRLFAVTANDEVNALAVLHFKDIFGRSEVYQLSYKKKDILNAQPVARDLRGRRLFREEMTYDTLYETPGVHEALHIAEIKTDDDLKNIGIESIIPLILINAQSNLIIYTDEQPPRPEPGMRLIYQTIA
jgi:NhaP-type Na+/H+ or K+/H+ antiporter